MVLIKSCGVEGCQTICRTCCSWTRADASFGVPSSDQIQTTFCRIVSTVASRSPSGLKAMAKTPRGDPADSGLMLSAEELDASAYSASPSALTYLSRQIVGACWSAGKMCERVVAEENYQSKLVDQACFVDDNSRYGLEASQYCRLLFQQPGSQ